VMWMLQRMVIWKLGLRLGGSFGKKEEEKGWILLSRLKKKRKKKAVRENRERRIDMSLDKG
ncbi:hypothetical protein, partial [Bacillus pumilus]|uniref:hypothetical protein n=1 Tax=Bacillus pumilus TaxID=1408 RepID=UPI001C92E20C